MASSAVPSSRKKTLRLGVEEQRNVLAEAAVDIFAMDGSNAVSVSAICKSAGVSRDTFYRCFTDKNALIHFLYQTTVNEHMLTALDSGDVDFGDRAWLRQATDETIDAILQDHRYARFLFVESGLPNSHAKLVIDQAYERVSRRMQDWCERNRGQQPPLELFKSMLIAVQWLVHNAINRGMHEQDVESAKQSVERLLYGVFSSFEQ